MRRAGYHEIKKDEEKIHYQAIMPRRLVRRLQALAIVEERLPNEIIIELLEEHLKERKI